jgi:hypothetical protein
MAQNQLVLLLILIGCLVFMYYLETSKSPSEVPEKIGDLLKRFERWINKQ